MPACPRSIHHASLITLACVCTARVCASLLLALTSSLLPDAGSLMLRSLVLLCYCSISYLTLTMDRWPRMPIRRLPPLVYQPRRHRVAPRLRQYLPCRLNLPRQSGHAPFIGNAETASEWPTGGATGEGRLCSCRRLLLGLLQDPASALPFPFTSPCNHAHTLSIHPFPCCRCSPSHHPAGIHPYISYHPMLSGAETPHPFS